MGNIFAGSDWHLFHNNILKFTDRNDVRIRAPFQSLDEMHECFIENHNSVVKPQDKYYHLGDVIFGQEKNYEIIRRFNGHKRLVLGNHDPNLKKLLFYFEKVYVWRIFREFDMTLVHVPVHPQSLKTTYCVHGHTHQNDIANEPNYINICMEKTNFKPINLEELRDKLKLKEHGHNVILF